MPVAGIGMGEFGAAVMEALAARGTVTQWHARAPGDVAAPGTLDGVDAVVLATSRPEPGAAERLDQDCHARGTPWFGVFPDDPVISVGPVIVPGAAPCFSCAERRRLQHLARPELRRALLDACARDPGFGVTGFSRGHVRLAAHLAQRTLARLEREPGISAGAVVTAHLDSLLIGRGRFVGIHGCARCGLRMDAQSRSYAGLLEVVPALRALGGVS